MADNIQQPNVAYWMEKCERLAAENERLRNGMATIRDRAKTLPHIVMSNGTPLQDYCRAMLIGPTQLPEKPKTVANEEATQG